MNLQEEYGTIPHMSDEKQQLEISDLVDPFLTEKTRRAVATAFGVPHLEGGMRTKFFRTLTVGKMLEHIPTYDKFCEIARKRGQLGPKTLKKARIIYE